MSKQLSIDEAARRLRAEWANSDEWDKCDWSDCLTVVKNDWRRVARLARKLFAQPAAKPRPNKPAPLVCEACGKSKRSVCRRTDHDRRRFYSCDLCWYHMGSDVFDRNVGDRRAKAAAKKARK